MIRKASHRVYFINLDDDIRKWKWIKKKANDFLMFYRNKCLTYTNKDGEITWLLIEELTLTKGFLFLFFSLILFFDLNSCIVLYKRSRSVGLCKDDGKIISFICRIWKILRHQKVQNYTQNDLLFWNVCIQIGGLILFCQTIGTGRISLQSSIFR